MSTATKSARKAIVITPSDREIRIERIFDAARDRVWRAHTDPKLLAQWWGRGNKLVIESSSWSGPTRCWPGPLPAPPRKP
jgi:hypothetical protein